MNKFILCQGIQGSGKTTWALNWIKEDPEHRVRWNNDCISWMINNSGWCPIHYGLIKNLRAAFINEAFANHLDIVIDDMNLNPNTINSYKEQVKYHNIIHPNNLYSFEIKSFNTPLEECIERDSKRENPIGEKIIRETYNKYFTYDSNSN